MTEETIITIIKVIGVVLAIVVVVFVGLLIYYNVFDDSAPMFSVTINNFIPGEDESSIIVTDYGGLLFSDEQKAALRYTLGYTCLGFFGYDDLQYYDIDGEALLVAYSDMKLICKWEPRKYEIEFMNGVTSLKKSNFVYNSNGNIAPQVPADTGYECAGWATSAGSTKKVLVNKNLSKTFDSANFPEFDFFCEKIQLYPVFEKKELSVNFSFTNSDVEIVTVKYGDFLPKAPAREYLDKRIVGWTTVVGIDAPFVGALTESITLYPIFADLRTLTFVTNGDAIAPIHAIDGEKIMLPKLDDTMNYTFMGWFLDGVKIPSLEYVVAGDCTLTAKWKGKDVRLILRGGAEEMRKTIEYGASFSLPVLTRTGYTFVGWGDYSWKLITNDQGESLAPWTSENKIVYACWLQNFTVSFVDNQYSQEVKPITACKGTVISLKKLIDQFGVFTFIGWSYNGTIYKDTFTINDSNAQLVAVWE